MRYRAPSLLVATALGLAPASPANTKEQRLQIGLYKSEEPLDLPSLDPAVQSVQWREGDIEVIFTQAAPCGNWIPANPVWEVERFNVVLNFVWYPQFPNASEPTALCKKHVRAWVFRVPQGNYTVTFAASLSRFHQHEGKVLSLPGRR